jgi:hypothetical protein
VRILRQFVLVSAAAFAVATGAAETNDATFPHFAFDVVQGDVMHAKTHLSSEVVITKMWYGDRVATTLEETVEKFRGCRLVRYGISSYASKDGNAIILNCGESFDKVLLTGGIQDQIKQLHYFSEAVAMPKIKPSSQMKRDQ